MKEEVNHVWLCDDLRTGAEDEKICENIRHIIADSAGN